MNDERSEALDQLLAAARELSDVRFPSITLTRTETNYRVDKAFGGPYYYPLPERLKADTLNYLLDGLVEPATEEAELLAACDLSYEAVDDWDGPGQVVQVVLSAPKPVYDRLQDKRLYGSLMSCMFQVCESIGSDDLRCRPE